jgi:Ca2+-binding RTX toxin-like protein
MRIFGGHKTEKLDGGPSFDSISGGQGDDTLFGYGDADTLDGAVGNDQIYGGGGQDSLLGGKGSDLLAGGNGSDTIFGGADSDTLIGGNGNDLIWDYTSSSTVYAGNGNDLVSVGGTANLVFSGRGDDLIYFYNKSSGSVVDAGAGDDRVDGAVGCTVDLGSGNDTLGTSAGGTIDLRSGNDLVLDFRTDTRASITTGAGSDRLSFKFNPLVNSQVHVTDFTAGPGGDVLDIDTLLSTLARAGWDGVSNPFTSGFLLIEQRGADAVVRVDLDGPSGPGGQRDLVIFDNLQASRLTSDNFYPPIPPGDPTFTGFSIVGTAADDKLVGTRFADTLLGGDGNDTLLGGFGRDHLEGGAGNDVLIEYGTGNTLDGGAGDDTFNVYFGNAPNILIGGAGHNVFKVQGDAVISGGDDGNYIYSTYGSIDVTTGAGNDVIWLVSETGDVHANDTIHSGAGDDVIAVSGSVSDGYFDTGEGNDTISGGENSTILAGDGNDVIYYASNSTVDAGTGDDWIRDAGGQVDLGAGNDTIQAAYGAHVTTGSGRDEVGIGLWSTTNILTTYITDFSPGPGGDVLNLSAVLQTLSLNGWDGNANPFGSGHLSIEQRGPDAVLVLDFDGPGTVYAPADLVVFENMDATHLTTDNLVPPLPLDGSTPAGLSLLGTTGDDVLAGGFGADTIEGMQGADRLAGDNGDDYLSGGDGNDTISGGYGSDSIDGGDGADNLSGGSGDDSIRGGSGSDSIYGGQGHDTVAGGLGDDLLSAGLGTTFTFAPGDGQDTIVGFRGGSDPNATLIDLTAYHLQSLSEIDIVDKGPYSLIRLPGGDSIVLNGVFDPALVYSGQFIL